MHERRILNEQCESMENVLIAIHWLNILLDVESLVSVENNVIRAGFFSPTADSFSFRNKIAPRSKEKSWPGSLLESN